MDSWAFVVTVDPRSVVELGFSSLVGYLLDENDPCKVRMGRLKGKADLGDGKNNSCMMEDVMMNNLWSSFLSILGTRIEMTMRHRFFSMFSI
jgi:hypothetical protein